MPSSMLVYMLRHGDALSPPGIPDSERPLSPSGREEIAAMAAFLESLSLRITCVVSSPLVRAVETADLVSTVLHIEKAIRSEYLVPGADQAALLHELDSLEDSALLLVGHEPHLSSFLSYLATCGAGLRASIRKGSAACLEGERPLTPGKFMLHWLLHASQLRRP